MRSSQRMRSSSQTMKYAMAIAVKKPPVARLTPMVEPSARETLKSAEPVVKSWADAVKKAGSDPDAVMKDFKAVLAKYKSAY